MTKTEKLAYVAGIIDGEGSLSIHVGYNANTNPKYLGRGYAPKFEPRVSVENASKTLIDLLMEWCGGARYIHGRKNRPKNHKQIHIWLLSNRAATDFLTSILPYLRIKHKQAELLIELQTHKNTSRAWNGQSRLKGGRIPQAELNKRLALKERLRILNQKGP